MSATEAELNDLSWRDLQARCREKGLVATGKKAELIQRLLEEDSSMPVIPTSPRKSNASEAAHSPTKSVASAPARAPATAQSPAVKKTITKEHGDILKLSEAERRAMRAQRFGLPISQPQLSTAAASPPKPAKSVAAAQPQPQPKPEPILSEEEKAKRASRAARFGIPSQ